MLFEIDVPNDMEEHIKKAMENCDEKYKCVKLITLVKTLPFGTDCRVIEKSQGASQSVLDELQYELQEANKELTTLKASLIDAKQAAYKKGFVRATSFTVKGWLISTHDPLFLKYMAEDLQHE